MAVNHEDVGPDGIVSWMQVAKQGPAWNDYFTFTIERNPFDRGISQFA